MLSVRWVITFDSPGSCAHASEDQEYRVVVKPLCGIDREDKIDTSFVNQIPMLSWQRLARRNIGSGQPTSARFVRSLPKCNAALIESLRSRSHSILAHFDSAFESCGIGVHWNRPSNHGFLFAAHAISPSYDTTFDSPPCRWTRTLDRNTLTFVICVATTTAIFSGGILSVVALP
jgi:hypothetical protein